MKKKNALVTGSSHGIGLEITRDLIAGGWIVFGLDLLDPPDILNHSIQSGTFIPMKLDLTSPTEIQSLPTKWKGSFPSFSVLINNAAISNPEPDPNNSLLEHWNRTIAVNLTGPFLLSHLLLPGLKKNRGCIIHIASTRAVMSEPGTEAYSASKGGLLSLTHSQAVSFGPDVRVNSISPGWIDTRSNDEKLKNPLDIEDHLQHPAGRVGVPGDISSLVQWLIDDKQGFVTGQNFIIDGGMTKKMIYR